MAIARQLVAAVKALLVLTVLLGVLYPAAILAVGLLAPGQANGSLIAVRRQGRRLEPARPGRRGAAVVPGPPVGLRPHR